MAERNKRRRTPSKPAAVQAAPADPIAVAAEAPAEVPVTETPVTETLETAAPVSEAPVTEALVAEASVDIEASVEVEAPVDVEAVAVVITETPTPDLPAPAVSEPPPVAPPVASKAPVVPAVDVLPTPKPVLPLLSLVETNRRNLTALVSAQRSVTQGYFALAQKQAEILREAVETARGILSDGTSRSEGANPVEQAQRAIQTALTNMKELAELATKANSEAIAIVNNRIKESLSELKSPGNHAL